MKHFRTTGLVMAAAAANLPVQALAQRVDENATTQSDDAFGKSVGSEKTGLYNNDNVRGFDPVEAGNVRMEGLYFDLVDRLSPRVVESSTIRVGPGALRYPFPAPSGLVDHTLTSARDSASLSLSLDNGGTLSMGMGGFAEFKLPIDEERLAISGGFGFRNNRKVEGGEARLRTFGATLAVRPSPDAEVLVFGSGFLFHQDHARPIYYPGTDEPPPQLERSVDLAQPWAERSTDTWGAGIVSKINLGKLRWETGAFLSRKDFVANFADLLSGIGQDGSVASRRIIADRGTSDRSWSGETRLVREWDAGTLNHRLTFSLRGRLRERRFGGSKTLQLGASTLLAPDLRVEPAYALGAKNVDKVRQGTVGLSYSLVSRDGFSLDASLSKSRYTKRVDFADPAAFDPVSRDDPWLWNVAGSVRVIDGVTLYAGITRGQEEALIAPDIATNRNEAPPAIRTRQVEAGVKLALAANVTLIAGAFSISKPYFNLDPALRYRQLGQLTNRGIELSLTGQLSPGLTLVGGTMLLDPRITGESVATGAIGPRPVGQVRRRTVANIDWRLDGGKSPLSFDLGIDSASRRVGNAANSLWAPPRTAVNLGARYRTSVAGSRVLIRPLIVNLFDDYGWFVSSSGGFTYAPPRGYTVQVIADF